MNDHVRAGDPGLPELSGREVDLRIRLTLDQQDSPIVPSRGLRVVTGVTHTFASPDSPDVERTNRGLTQFEFGASSVHAFGSRHRVFATLAGGTSFDDTPLPTRQFTVGYPFILDAFRVGEKRGDHYAVVTVGGMRRIGRLPDFLGGPVFAGAWFENGSVFNTHEKADTLGSARIADTLVGPALTGRLCSDRGWGDVRRTGLPVERFSNIDADRR